MIPFVKAGLTLLVFVFSYSVFSQTEPGTHSERGGIISIETENNYLNTGWIKQAYYSGDAVKPQTDENELEFQINIAQTGKYQLFILGNQLKYNLIGTSELELFFSHKSSETTQKISFLIEKGLAPKWMGTNSPVFFEIPLPGIYTLKIHSNNLEISIDKIILSLNGNYIPTGTGIAETLTTDTTPAELFPIILPPAWAFGVLYGSYTNQLQTQQAIDSLVLGDFPVDAYWIDSYFWDFNKGAGPKGYINFIGDTLAFPEIESLWENFEKLKIKSGIWIWDQIHETGNQEVYQYFNKNGFFSSTYQNQNTWHNEQKNTITGVINFENDTAAAYWKQQLKPFFDKGLDFLKLDNHSHVPYCKAAFTASQEFGLETKGRGFILAHLMNTKDPESKLYPTRWSGDAKICWSQPDYPNLNIYAMGGLKENIAMVSDPKLSVYEIPFLANDAGGYDYFGSNEQSDELYIRWMQFASLNSIMTVFSTAKNTTRNHPYRYSNDVQTIYKKYTHLRMQLFPYIYSEAFKNYLVNKKMVSGDRFHEHQFFLGDAILVAPVFEKGQTQKEVFIPDGKWFDFDTKITYSGPGTHSISTPIDIMPIFIKEGAIIPFRKYARAIEMGTNDTLLLKIFPTESESSYTFYEDDGISNDYLTGGFSETTFNLKKTLNSVELTIEPNKGSYTGMAHQRYYSLTFELTNQPQSVTIDGYIYATDKKTNPLINFNEKEKQLTLELKSNKSIGNKIILTFENE